MSIPKTKKINLHLQQFQTKEMSVPVIFHTSDALLPNQHTFDQLENLGKDKRLFSHIAAMSDVHPKAGRKNPTGTIVASKTHLFPQINDTAPNCGMRFLRTDLNDQNLTEEKIDELFKELIEVIPTKKYVGNKIPYQLAVDIAHKGIDPLLSHLKSRTKNELENSSMNGNMVPEEISQRDIFDAIPKFFFHVGKYRLGILGAAGNHFLDLMKITEIKDNEIAEKFNLKVGQYIFLMHTGSGLFGQYASYMYTPKTKEHFSQKMMLKIQHFSTARKNKYTKISPKK
ncbi:MAG: hypothetical protein US66_C0016G0006 [Candidatus Moranbacteria bacterium GW2011_GWD2_37_9]|nr:MAG: hypothetical protein US66_C0016G0006 [Candidatus Moranbacteria bacterium GW2011_GWD2_37_9]